MEEEMIFYYKTITNELIMPLYVKDPSCTKSKKCISVWDTGSEKSLIDINMATILKLKEMGTVHIGGIYGNGQNCPLFNVFIFLPKCGLYYNLIVAGINLSTFAPNKEKFIIGMDVISKGDFHILNSDKKTAIKFKSSPINSPINLDLLTNRPIVPPIKITNAKKTTSPIPPKSPRPSKPPRTPSKRTEIDKALERMLGYDPKKDKRNKPNKK